MSLETQRRFDTANPSKEKMAAKKRCAELVSGEILDLGGEPFYQHLFNGNVDTVNLPDDIHTFTTHKKYDSVCALHLLEHSPIPLAVILTAYDALKEGGVFYVSVPTIDNNYFVEMPEHWTVLPKNAWKKLLVRAGFKIELEETGIFGNYRNALEYRFLGRK